MLKGTSGYSLFQEAVQRVADTALFAPPFVVANVNHREHVREQLAQVGCDNARMLLEPVARNTAVAMTLAALELPPETAMLVLPSDHVIEHPAPLIEAVRDAAPAVAAGHVVIFAVPAREPNTAYGYIEIGQASAQWPNICHVRRFTEKPDMATARGFIEAGNYAWNSGIFLLRAELLIAKMQAYAPEILSACRAAIASATRTDAYLIVDEAALVAAPALPFDRAVMEHAQRAFVRLLEMGWRDMGSWEAIAQLGETKA